MVLAAASQRDLESAKELLPGSHRDLVGSTWDLPQGDPRSGWQGPTTTLPGGADQSPQTPLPIPPRSWGTPGSLLPAAVSPAGSAGIRGLAGGAAVAPRRGQPGGHAAGAGRGAGAGPRGPVHPDTAPSALAGRKLSGKAGIDEVMAAAVLTSLSASPLVLGHPPATHAPEPGSEVWKEAPAMSSSCSSSSNTSGDWSWDPSSDRSTPSTPSPPLSSHPDGTHFIFGEPIPRKRKNSTKVMFKCLWKSCGKVLSSSSGMQKHIRTMHLGRKADLEQSDGEEDFYYTELDVDVDALTDGLSSLTPVSPTSSVPPAFPGPEAPPPPALGCPFLSPTCSRGAAPVPRAEVGACPPSPPPGGFLLFVMSFLSLVLGSPHRGDAPGSACRNAPICTKPNCTKRGLFFLFSFTFIIFSFVWFLFFE
uniref:SLC2A4 regulator n=1 Tax=Cyanoderma ruficeps TaxID=181631 RepID=A0A8C3QUR4_9PASS